MTDTLTVQDVFRSHMKTNEPNSPIPYDKPLLVWNQFNRIAEEVWARGGQMCFIGADRTKDKKTMFCAFEDDEGKIYCVENDVVFRFQKDKKPIVRLI